MPKEVTLPVPVLGQTGLGDAQVVCLYKGHLCCVPLKNPGIASAAIMLKGPDTLGSKGSKHSFDWNGQAHLLHTPSSPSFCWAVRRGCCSFLETLAGKGDGAGF